jgi:hypothetical protein
MIINNAYCHHFSVNLHSAIVYSDTIICVVMIRVIMLGVIRVSVIVLSDTDLCHYA